MHRFLPGFEANTLDLDRWQEEFDASTRRWTREYNCRARASHGPRAVVRLGGQGDGTGVVADRGGGGDLERIFRGGSVTTNGDLRETKPRTSVG